MVRLQHRVTRIPHCHAYTTLSRMYHTVKPSLITLCSCAHPQICSSSVCSSYRLVGCSLRPPQCNGCIAPSTPKRLLFNAQGAMHPHFFLSASFYSWSTPNPERKIPGPSHAWRPSGRGPLAHISPLQALHFNIAMHAPHCFRLDISIIMPAIDLENGTHMANADPLPLLRCKTPPITFHSCLPAQSTPRHAHCSVLKIGSLKLAHSWAASASSEACTPT